MRVPCTVHEIEMDSDGDYDTTVPGVCVTCSRCSHEVEVYGTSSRSVRRGLVMLREECLKGESNFYVAPEAEQ